MNNTNKTRAQKQCSICGKIQRTEKVIDGKSICPSCYQKNFAPKRICSICNQEKVVTKKLGSDSICPSCYKKYYLPKELCSVCNHLNQVYCRIDGKAVCRSCYRKNYAPKQVCSVCGKYCITENKINEMFICRTCYRKHYSPKQECSICKTIDTVAKITEEGSICPKCYRKFYKPKKTCSICNKEKSVGKTLDGNPICESCYKKYYLPRKVCSICNNEDIVQKVIDDKNICPKCYRKLFVPKKICFICNKESITKKIVDGHSICPVCYKKFYRTKRICSVCGNEDFISKTLDGFDICYSCYKKKYIPKKVCSICGNESIISKKDNEKNICPTCYSKYYRPIGVCSICGESKVISRNKEGLYVCNSCYNKHYRPQRICIICGNLKTTNKLIDEGSICPSCYKRYFVKYLCSGCGKEISFYYIINGMRFCSNCYINENQYHLEQIKIYIEHCKLSFSNISIYNLLFEFSKHLLLYRKPFSVYSMIVNQLNIFYYIDKSYVSLEILDYSFFKDMYDNASLNLSLALENFLIKEGILKRQTSLEQFISYFDSLQHNLTDVYADTLNQYSNFLIARKERLIQHGYYEKFTIITFKQYIRLSQLFLEFLQKYQVSINEINNDHITDFLVSNNNDYIHKQLKYFVIWINQNIKLFRKLYVPKFIRSDKRKPYSDKELTVIINSLNANSTPYRDKAICYLSLLYSLRPFELSKIKLSDYIISKNRAKLFVRGTWISLNPYISDLIDKYIEYERNSTLSFGSNIDWMFFGNQYDRPLSDTTIYTIFYEYNLLSTKAFTTSISNLIMEGNFSPSIIIKGLGIKNGTACDYYKLSGISNVQYLENLDIPDSLHPIGYGHYIYILKCCDGSYYTGYTSDIQKRLQQHQNGTGCTYTKTRTPVELVYTEKLPDKSTALKREKQIKKLTIFEKEKLIKKVE